MERDWRHCPSGKLDIDFITLWDDPMQDGSVTIIHIFELFKQTALIGVDKIWAGSDDCREWQRVNLILLWIIKNQASKTQNFMEINLSSFDYDFCLTRCRSLLFYVLLKTSYVFMGYRKGTSEWNGLIFQLTKVLSTNKIWAHVNNGVWGQGQLFLKK